MTKPFVYKCTLDRVVDGDTVDVNIDLGFKIVLAKQRVRLVGIDTPESRTRDLAEKKLGLQAKDLLKELTQDGFVLESQGRGKYGRIVHINLTAMTMNNTCNFLDTGFKYAVC